MSSILDTIRLVIAVLAFGGSVEASPLIP